jgi:hypothetical protein
VTRAWCARTAWWKALDDSTTEKRVQELLTHLSEPTGRYGGRRDWQTDETNMNAHRRRTVIVTGLVLGVIYVSSYLVLSRRGLPRLAGSLIR